MNQLTDNPHHFIRDVVADYSRRSALEFFAIGNDTRWTFVKTPDGRIQEVIARTGNHEVHRRRLP